MDMLNSILHRRSVRQYTDEPISDATLSRILYAGLAAASSKNRRPWELIVVRNRETLTKLGDCRSGAANLLGNCSAAIVVAANSALVDVWVEDCASAMTQMHLMADAAGIGSCWLQIRLRNTPDGCRSSQSFVQEVLGIPDQYSVMAILTLGVPTAHPGAKSIDDLPLEKIHYDHF